MPMIFVRGQAVEVADHQATVLAGLGMESYLRLGELWNQDQQQRYVSAGQQQQAQQVQQQQRPRQLAPARVDQNAIIDQERREAIADIIKSRGQA